MMTQTVTQTVNYLSAKVENLHKLPVYRYMAEVASNDCDEEGIPLTFKTIDVVVTEPGDAAVKELIAATKWLEGYTMVHCWEPWDETGLPDDAPF